ncbi:ArsA family ATPase [Enemella evansiae]|uniref:ATPase n=1 Tax=Enemella evansiae TaxID=2016499 RepID=A0A255GUE3_9ACTN|nr:ArsA-related P-loop ATPase [Enemella evansiae]PFG65778.1 anion-transporting ArsA/GET3 family ATPase [Propionibacteriaceae bacterium ES.041]OYO02018.1 ATPase [Enemella evansiae]OYO02134.1 ATPase [Enemella evansiae]OYO10817.1 ATPase [Enemella evansiae]OYO15846.1 ATPase [Enemella evansiae]
MSAARDALQIDPLLADRGVEILICCGSGGVGKTTTSAALALRAAEQGRRVVVLTIDPARRLAQSLGLTELDNTPREVVGVDTAAGGRLDAMMLDMKRTFDDVVLAHASSQKAEQILANPFYQALSTSFSGTQEYMAMEKLGQLHDQARREGRWDLIVVDTPPSRSALDFLEAPEHLSRLLDGRMLKMLLAPARGPFKLMSVGVNLVMGAMDKILGAQVLRDVQTFVTAFDTLFGGFRQRAEKTLTNLSSAHTRFLVVATPTRDALREAAYFTERLREEKMPLAGVVVNRVHTSTVDLSADRAMALAEEVPEKDRPSRLALHRHAERMRGQERERDLVHRFGVANPGVRLAEIPAQTTDVNDLATLRAVGAALAADTVAR